MAVTRIPSDVDVAGHLTMGTVELPNSSVSDATVKSNASIARSKLAQDTLARFSCLSGR